MDIEQLTKGQIVLLTLLVSFVTSLATGIVTVSLMEQGVAPVTNTVNKIVERTKEIIVQEAPDPIIITEEKTVIVREADLIAEAVKRNAQSTVSIYFASEAIAQEGDQVATTSEQMANILEAIDSIDEVLQAEGTLEQESATTTQEQIVDPAETTLAQAITYTFVARGALIADKLIVVDSTLVEEGIDYRVVFDDGTETLATLVAKSSILSTLEMVDSVGTPITISESGVSRGETVIALSGTTRARVITALVADFLMNENGVEAIDVNVGSVVIGALLINTQGEAIGMSTVASQERGALWFSGETALQDTKALIE